MSSGKMREKVCNIWDLADDHAIVVPTNMGWRKDGTNVMGRGIAKQAAERYEHVPFQLGEFYRRAHQLRIRNKQAGVNDDPPILIAHEADGTELVFVPSKKLITPAFLSWKQSSSQRLVRKGLWKLRGEVLDKMEKERLAVPLIGAGNGQLPMKMVASAIRLILGDCPQVTMVIFQERLVKDKEK